MKYIKKIILENFQSHKYTEMELDKYLNVIVGPSDQGKSAIIRGLKWALFNEPSGDFFIREGEKECSVTVIFNDNTKIKRFRSKSKNAYYLYDKYGKEMAFEGFGTTVPQEIIDKISIRKISLDSNQSNSINIGEQLEGPFLLSEKNSTRANAIGRLVGVHIIDDALKDTLRDIRNLNIKKKNHEETLEKLEENLFDYNYLNDLVYRVNKLEDIRLEIYNNQNRLNKLVILLDNLNKVNEEIKSSYQYLGKLENVYKVIEIEKNLTLYINNYNFINDKYYKLNRIKTQIKIDSELVNSLANIDKANIYIKKISLLNEKTQGLKKLYKNYKLYSNNILKTKNMLKKLDNIEKVEENLILMDRYYLRYKELIKLKNKLDIINKNLSVGIVYTEKLSTIDQAFYLENVLENKYKKLEQLIKYKNKYNKLIENIIKERNTIKILEGELDENLLKYKSILTKIEICPLCYSNIDKFKIDKIINNYK